MPTSLKPWTAIAFDMLSDPQRNSITKGVKGVGEHVATPTSAASAPLWAEFACCAPSVGGQRRLLPSDEGEQNEIDDDADDSASLEDPTSRAPAGGSFTSSANLGCTMSTGAFDHAGVL